MAQIKISELDQISELASDDLFVSVDTSESTTKKATLSQLKEVIGSDYAKESEVVEINNKIPAQATESNKLADKDFVNSSINSVTAFYITKNASGEHFATKAELDSTTTFYSGGEVRVPTRNDYCIVQEDETKENATTRYIYNNSWEYQYTVNETALTSDQIKALNSGITAELVASYVKNTDYATQTKAGVVKIYGDWYGIDINSDGVIIASKMGYADYNARATNMFISKGTLENVFTGKNIETANNKVTSISSSSTDTEYPSAKAVYEKIKPTLYVDSEGYICLEEE